jgi:predicted anti-sigma-YlaC factor YlaD
MNCEELFQLLPGYLDADMKQEICHDLEAHMRQCSYCRAHVHTMRDTVDLTRNLNAPVVHQEWVGRLRERICRGPGSEPA